MNIITILYLAVMFFGVLAVISQEQKRHDRKVQNNPKSRMVPRKRILRNIDGTFASPVQRESTRTYQLPVNQEEEPCVIILRYQNGKENRLYIK
jgi:hypothetical protein